MRSVLMRPLAILLLAFMPCLAFGQGTKVSTENRPPKESERDNPKRRSDWFLKGRTVNGRPASQELHRAHQQKMAKRRAKAAARSQTSLATSSESTAAQSSVNPAPSFTATVGGPSWVPLGPAPTATSSDSDQDYGPAIGRATAVVVDQNDITGNTVYVGGASGGLWKSTNAADPFVANCTNPTGSPNCAPNVTWTPLIDNQASLTVGSIAIQPGNTNVILVGTGEANNSADSYYGLGILRSTDGGSTWTLISSATTGQNFHGLGFRSLAFDTDPGKTNVVVTTAAAASGGIAVGAETGGSNVRGIYYSMDGGASWARANVSDGNGQSPDPGSANSVIFNPFTHQFYANIRYHGFYSSSDGANWTRLGVQPGGSLLSLTACPSTPFNSNCPLYRAEIAIVPGRSGPNNLGEMYVFIVDVNDADQGIYQTVDGGATWTAISTTGMTAAGNCGDGFNNGCDTEQGTYNLTLAAVPDGGATDLYAGAINEFKCTINSQTNPTCSNSAFINLTHTYGTCGTATASAFSHVHPDEHGIDFLRTGANPGAIMYFANDGGIYRTLNSFTTTQALCNSKSQQQIRFDNLSQTMGSMIQFVWFSHHPTDPLTMFGGTQDNGSPGKNTAASSYGASWVSVNNGDGGFNDINPLNPNEWFTSNTDVTIYECVNGSGITCTNNSFGNPIIDNSTLGGDQSTFYPVFMLDPQAVNHMLASTCRLWRVDAPGTRSNPWTAATALSYNLDQFSTHGTSTCSGSSSNFASAIAAGGPCNGTCNPGANPPGGTNNGGGSQVIYVGTEGGTVFVTANADANDPKNAISNWSDRTSGLGSNTACGGFGCKIGGIAIDPHDATGNTAYVAVMGFGTGHVFKTTNAGATWTLLDGSGAGAIPDAPANAVVADPVAANLVYVATDVGVFKLDTTNLGSINWVEVGPTSGPGMLPNVATTALKVYKNGSDVRLRVSTYGRGIWEMPLTGFTMAVTPTTTYAFPSHSTSFAGSINAANYSSSIAITCGSGAPSPCSPPQSPITVGGGNGNASFTVSAGPSAIGDYSFNIVATGNDTNHLTQQAPVTLHVADFTVAAPASASVGAGDTANVTVGLGTTGTFNGTVALACPTTTPAPSSGSITCSFAQPSVVLAGSTNVSLAIVTTSAVPPNTYNVTVQGTGTLASGQVSHSQTIALTVGSAAFSLAGAPSSLGTAKPGQSLGQGAVTVSSQSGYAGTLNLSCAFDLTAGNPGSSTCALDAHQVTLAANGTATAHLTVNTAGAAATNPSVVVTATDASTGNTATTAFTYAIQDYAVAITTPGTLLPNNSSTFNILLTPLNGYSSTVAVQCTPTQQALSCSLSPSLASFASYTVGNGTVTSITVTVTAQPNTSGGNYPVIVGTQDTNFTSLVHNITANLLVQDFNLNLPPGTPTAAVIKAGQNAVFQLSVASSGLNVPVNFSCAGLPSLATCNFSPNPVSAGATTTLTIATTAPTVSDLRPPVIHRGAPLYALWLTMPGMVIGLVSIGGIGKRNRSRWLSLIGFVLAATLLVALIGCGGGGGSSSTTSPPVPHPGTPAGTYTITVTGTATTGGVTLTHSMPITLTVQ
ncbi:MAG: hypothetical protein ACR2IF_03750 [Terriglobales bacterium]